jgi:aminopeptidase
MDPRWQRLGEILVHYSTSVKPGERVMIAMTEVDTFPLARAVYSAVVQAGGYPQVQLLSEKLRHSVLAYGNDDQIGWVPEMEAWGMEWADVYIGLRGANNLYELQGIPASKLAANQAAMGKVSTARWEKTRWCLVRVPNEALTLQARMRYEELEEMFFNSCFLNWENEGRTWEAWSKKLGKGKEIRILGHETDLSFSVEGRKWVPFNGINNMPDGEIATAPVTSTVDGSIFFENPGVLGGRLIHGIRLTWKQGELIKASSQTEKEFFQQIIAKDEGASKIGEFAFGTNTGVYRFCNDILLDEKILGTIHIALGRAYPECGGINQSSIHWDIIKDLREGGTVLMDGEPIIIDGIIKLEQE